jgi:hypothetical protein
VQLGANPYWVISSAAQLLKELRLSGKNRQRNSAAQYETQQLLGTHIDVVPTFTVLRMQI